MMKKTVIAIISGYFNPLRRGHIELFERAKEISDRLVVIVNNDDQRETSGTGELHREGERCKIISSLKPVDGVFLSIDVDGTVRESLKLLSERYKKMENDPMRNPATQYKLIFINGGERFSNEVAERDVCNEYGIYMIDRMGDVK